MDVFQSPTRDQPQAIPQVASATRLAWLDGMRAVAIVGVVIVHSSQVVLGVSTFAMRICELGQYGVQLFFVISAITIYLTLRSHIERQSEPVSAWYVRRFFRIAPLYYIAILAYAADRFLLSRLQVLNSEVVRPRAFMANVCFVHSWVPTGNNNVVPGGWSIGVEMSFYLIAPFLFIMITRRKWWPGLFVVLGVLSLLLVSLEAKRKSGSFQVANNSFLYFLPLTQLPVFLIAMAMVQQTKSWFYSMKPTPKGWNRAAIMLAILGTTAGGYCGAWDNRMPVISPALFGVGFSGVALVARSGLKALFGSPIMSWLGTISYSMYIVHFGVLDGFRFLLKTMDLEHWIPPTALVALLILITIGMSAAIASIAHRLIEEPGVRLGARVASILQSRQLGKHES